MNSITTIKRWKTLSKEKKRTILRRSQDDIDSLTKKVVPIMKRVQQDGDSALINFNLKFDKVKTTIQDLQVKPKELHKAPSLLSHEVKKGIEIAFRNVKKYHSNFLPKYSKPFQEVSQGVYISEKITPIDSVGIYIPRGKGSFPSMVYMLAVPALLAKVPRKVIVTPPLLDGTIDPACLYAAQLCEVDEIYKVGGAHAIAALAYGTKKIKKVTKIIGPASSFVTAAKQYVDTIVDIGPHAGPSEAIIICDGTTSPELVAYDLCIEAEHGPDSMSIVLTHKRDYGLQIMKHLSKIINNAPESTKKTLTTVFNKYCSVILTENEEESITISNTIAPEHLTIHSTSPTNILSHITNAGEILLGEHSPSSVANYAAGANAVIPTSGRAKTTSPVNISDFIKTSSIINITPGGLRLLSPHVQHLARYEGFYFHEQSLIIRQKHSHNNKLIKNN